MLAATALVLQLWAVRRPALWLDESASVVATQRTWPHLWRLAGGAVLADRQPMARAAPGSLPGPVSVLVDGGTASAGEAVAVAFRGVPDVRSYGSPTLGMSSSNETVPLPDGAVLNVTTSRFADRNGQVYGSRISPDVPTDDPLSMALWDG